MYRDGFLCPLADEMMGATAETLADRYEISRDEQDAFAVESQRRPARVRGGRFADEIVPVRCPARRRRVIDNDEHPRFDADLGSLAKLPPVFRKNGTVHAGNSSGVTDGASSMLVASADAVAAARAHADGAHRRLRAGRRRSEDHGHRPRSRDAQAARGDRRARSTTSTSSS